MSIKRNKTGFTLIELLAVTVLIGMLASVTMLRYAKMGSQTVLTNQTRQLYLAARYARIVAIEQHTSVVLSVDNTSRLIALEPVVSDTSATATTPGFDEPGITAEMLAQANTIVGPVRNAFFKPVALDSKLMVEQFLVDGSETENQCTFYPDGTATSSLIQLGDGLRHATVLVTQTGRVKMQLGMVERTQTGRVDLDLKE